MGKGGGGSSSQGSVQTVQPSLSPLPNQDLLNSVAMWAIQRGNPWTSNPWRAMDYFQGFQAPTQYIPQFQPNMGFGGWPQPMPYAPQVPQYPMSVWPPPQAQQQIAPGQNLAFHAPGGAAPQPPAPQAQTRSSNG